jgi:hypothetical protein
MGRRTTNKTEVLEHPAQVPAAIETELTKEDVYKMLKLENPSIKSDCKYNQLFVVLKLKRLRKNLGIIKGELISNDQIEYRGSLLLPISETDQPSQWKHIEVGKSEFLGFSLDTREASLTEKLSGVVSRSLEEGKIQDILSIFSIGR